jgi:hypothetical protein
MTEEKLIHSLISDAYLITNESSGSKPGGPIKTFLYEFSQDGKQLNVDDLDIILCTRLGKQKTENKFTYLYNAFERIDSHIVAKRKQSADLVVEMKSITARYFVTCLSCPDTFDLVNDTITVPDGDQS